MSQPITKTSRTHLGTVIPTDGHFSIDFFCISEDLQTSIARKITSKFIIRDQFTTLANYKLVLHWTPFDQTTGALNKQNMCESLRALKNKHTSNITVGPPVNDCLCVASHNLNSSFGRWFSKYGPQTSSTNSHWEMTGNENSQALPQT